MNRAQGLLLVLGLAVSSILTGCGNASPTSAPEAKEEQVIKIATQSPLSGSLSLEGDGIKRGAELAIKDHAEEFRSLGFSLQLSPQDDQADPKIGVSNAEMLIADSDVLAVIGHYNTGVAIPASAKYEEGHLAMISPANTGVELTEGGKQTVNRLVARNDQIAPAIARYAKEQMGVTSVFYIHDKTAYGQGLADEVRKAFGNFHVTELGYEGITPGEKDYNAIVNQVIAKKPDLIFYGGMYAEVGIIAKQAKDKGYSGKIMGGEGLESKDIYKIAGDAAEGIVYATVVGDIRSREEGKKWLERYQQQFGQEPGAFSAFAYDATLVAINGIKQAIQENGKQKPTREQVMKAIRATKDFKGSFTEVSFDEKGDNTYSKVYIYRYGKEQAEFVGEAQ
nr:branched-chain amino acid ABC transporter substrate-binding protein [Brevibacillus fulvus]